MPTKKHEPEVREDGKVKVYSQFITIKGKRIPPPKGQRCWVFWAHPRDNQAANDEGGAV